MSTKPKVLLLGDSIRMSYQSHAAELLKDKAEVVGPGENGQYALYTLTCLDRWVGVLGEPDVVHWNNGIHDCGYNPRRAPMQFPLADYIGNLRHILDKLKQWTDKIIWATTTPIHPDFTVHDQGWWWDRKDVDRYNGVATAFMKAQGIPINDLNSLVWENRDQYMRDDSLHLNEKGEKACAEVVAEAISAML